MKRNVYLMGFMCSGKTRVGLLLAERLDMSFLDTDDWIADQAGLSVPEIFEQFGEPHFRMLEKKAIQHASALQNYVIALGGGAVMNDANWKTIARSGVTICLSYPPNIIESRLARQTDRPLVQEQDPSERLERIEHLLSQRQERYGMADLVFHLNHETDPENIADALAGYLGRYR